MNDEIIRRAVLAERQRCASIARRYAESCGDDAEMAQFVLAAEEIERLILAEKEE